MCMIPQFLFTPYIMYGEMNDICINLTHVLTSMALLSLLPFWQNPSLVFWWWFLLLEHKCKELYQMSLAKSLCIASWLNAFHNYVNPEPQGSALSQKHATSTLHKRAWPWNASYQMEPHFLPKALQASVTTLVSLQATASAIHIGF